ncbi:MAG: UMP kinase [Candidatus Nitrosocosmicus sp.]
MNKDKIVIKLSGSIFNFNTDFETLNNYIGVIKKISQLYQPIIITGGGKIARFYINLSRSLGFDESGLDLMGIQVSHLNAKLLIAGLKNLCFPITPKNLDEVSTAVLTNKIVVTGGLYPGQSTNATSALIAENINAIKFFNATDVDGIFNLDPRTNPHARMYDYISVKECIKILKIENSMAGTYDLMDLISLKVIERSKLSTFVFKSSVDNLEKIILGGVKIGTEITA